MNTQDIRESYIPCQCEQSGQHLLWLWDALDEVDRLTKALNELDRLEMDRLRAESPQEPNPRGDLR